MVVVGQDAKPRGPPRKMLEMLFTDEVLKPDVLQSKFGKSTEHFYVLYVGWLIVYKQEVDTKDRASQEQLVSRIPLSVCSVAESAQKKDTSTEHSFQIKIDNHKRCSHRTLQPFRLLDCVLNNRIAVQLERRAVHLDLHPSNRRTYSRTVAGCSCSSV